MNVRYEKNYSPALLRQFSEEIFVFEDTMQRKGKTGYAVVREESNAFGIPTKRLATKSVNAFFNDQPDEVEAMVKALRELYKAAAGKTLVFPTEGFGVAGKLEEKSPEAWAKLQSILKDHFKAYLD